ncbi:hypothetical protein DPEC_G00304300, partial [Dallia pectoralis]
MPPRCGWKENEKRGMPDPVELHQMKGPAAVSRLGLSDGQFIVLTGKYEGTGWNYCHLWHCKLNRELDHLNQVIKHVNKTENVYR